jgi:hypothetical protein
LKHAQTAFPQIRGGNPIRCGVSCSELCSCPTL